MLGTGTHKEKQAFPGFPAFPAILALVLIICVPACSSGTHSSSDSRSRTDFEDKTETKITTLQVRPAMTSNNLRMRVDLTEGSIGWTLRDPEDDVRWEEESVAPARWNESVIAPCGPPWISRNSGYSLRGLNPGG